MRVLEKVKKYRNEEEGKYESCGCTKLGNFTTVNVTMLQAGMQLNVVPAKAMAGIDVRISPKTGIQQFQVQFALI